MAILTDPTLTGQDVAVIVATTLENIKPQLIDSVSTNDAFFFYMNQNERIDYEDGGYSEGRLLSMIYPSDQVNKGGIG